MAYVDELLGKDEQILYEANQHILILISRILTGLSLIAVLVTAGVVSNEAFGHNLEPVLAGMNASDLLLSGTFLISIAVLASIFGTFLNWNATQYIITDRRVIQVYGAFNKVVIEAGLSKINDVTMNQSVLGRMFNYGTIDIATSSEETSSMIDGIVAPMEFKRVMMEAKYNYERGYGYLQPPAAVRPAASANAAPQPGATPAQPFDVRSTLEELARLRDRGILSTDEFEAKKREILNRI